MKKEVDLKPLVSGTPEENKDKVVVGKETEEGKASGQPFEFKGVVLQITPQGVLGIEGRGINSLFELYGILKKAIEKVEAGMK